LFQYNRILLEAIPGNWIRKWVNKFIRHISFTCGEGSYVSSLKIVNSALYVFEILFGAKLWTKIIHLELETVIRCAANATSAGAEEEEDA